MLILNIILWIFLILVSLVVLVVALVLFMPILYQIEGEYCSGDDLDTPGTKVSLQISWLFKLLSFFYTYTQNETIIMVKIGYYKLPDRFLAFLAPSAEELPKHKKKKLSLKTISQTLSNNKSLLTNIDTKSIISLCVRLVKKLLKKVGPRELRVTGKVGFGDPCTTGRVIGLYEALAGALHLRQVIDIQSDFSKQNFELEFFIAGRFALISIILTVVWFVLQKPIRGVFKALRSQLNIKGSNAGVFEVNDLGTKGT